MRKLAIALFAVIALSGNANAQLPFPGMSKPVLDGPFFESYPGLDGGTWYGVGLFHHGVSVENPPTDFYYVSVDRWLQKRQPDGSYQYMTFQNTFRRCGNASAASPNSDKYYFGTVDAGDLYGSGTYRIGLSLFGYNPVTNVRVFMTSVYQNFVVP